MNKIGPGATSFVDSILYTQIQIPKLGIKTIWLDTKHVEFKPSEVFGRRREYSSNRLSIIQVLWEQVCEFGVQDTVLINKCSR